MRPAWTKPEDVAAKIARLWERGDFSSAEIVGKTIFPLEIPIKGPRSAELAERFEEVRAWVRVLQSGSKERRGKGYNLSYRRVQSRELGRNELPDRAVIDSPEDALFLVRRSAEAARFRRMVADAESVCPALIAYLERKRVAALPLAEEWPSLMRTALWVSHNPHPGIYPRQIDLPGIDTKFLERNSKALSEMIDALDVIPGSPLARLGGERASGLARFCARYGFLAEPLYVRFRPPQGNGLFPDSVSELALPAPEFARLSFPPRVVRRIFVTENKVNFLAFPRQEGALVIWGGGYCFEHLADAAWLDMCEIFYWGDIDTNGLAILDQFRARFPASRSLLMDVPTLLEHKAMWGVEQKQRVSALTRLDENERDLYAALLENRYGVQVRLEQERIAYGRVVEALSSATR